MSTIALSGKSFSETVSRDGIVMVDFWAAWCGPCRAFAPVFEAAATEHPDIVFAKVDTEAEPALSRSLGIMSIPTLMVFRDGILVFEQPGAQPPAVLARLIDAVRDLDMDAVRQEMTAPGAAAETAAETA
jgi:thioredoxin 1